MTTSSCSAGQASTQSSSTRRQPTTPATKRATRPASPNCAHIRRSGSTTNTATTFQPTPIRRSSACSSCPISSVRNVFFEGHECQKIVCDYLLHALTTKLLYTVFSIRQAVYKRFPSLFRSRKKLLKKLFGDLMCGQSAC